MRMSAIIELTPRLEQVAEYIPAGESVIDIGTDHAYLPLSVILSGKCPSAIAADVRPGPLEAARKHIQECQAEERVTVRLSNGLDAFLPEELECVVMAGMGGRLIAELITRAGNQGRLTCCHTLVLQPQSEPDRVRRALHETGWQIQKEAMIEDRGKFYVVMQALPGQECYSEEEYEYGRRLFELRDPVFYRVLTEHTEKERKIIAALQERNDASETVRRRLKVLEDTICREERMLRAWDAQ